MIVKSIQEYLESTPNFRERSRKNAGIAWILKEKYSLEIDVSRLEAVITDASTMDRQWRKALQDNPHLRGKDYGDKDELEEATQKALGYKEKAK